MKKEKLILILCLVYVSSTGKAQGYEILVKMPQIKNQNIILGHYFTKGDMLIPDDTVTLDNNGRGAFKGKEKLGQGMYFMYLPSRRTFELLIGQDQKFSVENDTTDLYKNLKISGDEENRIFVDYQNFNAKFIDKRKELTAIYENTADAEKKKKLETEFRKMSGQIDKKQEEIISAYPNSFFSKLLKSYQEVKIPEPLSEQKDKYYYYRSNYFKYFDYKDQRLLRTPVYESKLDYYLDKVLPQIPDTLIAEVDILIKNSRHDKELFRFMLVHLFNKYGASNLMGAENVWVHIAEKYYIPEADWSNKEYIEELKTKVARKKTGLIGNIAPELKMIMLPKDPASIETVREVIETMKNSGDEFLKNEALIKERMDQYKANYPNLSDSALRSQVIISELALLLEEQLLPTFEGYISVYEQATKYTILWFWEPDCSHCKEQSPKFLKAYDDKKLKDLGVTVIPVYLQRNINEWDKYTKHLNTWLDFVLKHNMLKWTNVWEPFGYSHFRDKYDISSSPVLYLLDKDKKIIAKRIGYDQAIGIIEDLERVNKM